VTATMAASAPARRLGNCVFVELISLTPWV
jgi:hypothetical protein